MVQGTCFGLKRHSIQPDTYIMVRTAEQYTSDSLGKLSLDDNYPGTKNGLLYKLYTSILGLESMGPCVTPVQPP